MGKSVHRPRPVRVVLQPCLKIYSAASNIMDSSLDNEQPPDTTERWLNSRSRCFGDKGDVEDITEGLSSPREAGNRLPYY